MPQALLIKAETADAKIGHQHQVRLKGLFPADWRFATQNNLRRVFAPDYRQTLHKFELVMMACQPWSLFNIACVRKLLLPTQTLLIVCPTSLSTKDQHTLTQALDKTSLPLCPHGQEWAFYQASLASNDNQRKRA